MAFTKKNWLDRNVEHPNRRRLVPENGGAEQQVRIHRDEGIIYEEGVPYDADTMNDMEQRIGDGFDAAAKDIAAVSTRAELGITNAANAYTLANTANTTANAARTTANNALPKTGGTINGNITANVVNGVDVSVTGGALQSRASGNSNMGQIYTNTTYTVFELHGPAGFLCQHYRGGNAPMYASNTTLPSSKRYKHNIQPLNPSDAKSLLDLDVVQFKYNADTAFDDSLVRHGMIAEDVAKINPAWIFKNPDGEIEGINYASMVPDIIKLVQIQQKQIDDLTKKVTALEEKQCT